VLVLFVLAPVVIIEHFFGVLGSNCDAVIVVDLFLPSDFARFAVGYYFCSRLSLFVPAFGMADRGGLGLCWGGLAFLGGLCDGGSLNRR
jgi:hypothetical protein